MKIIVTGSAGFIGYHLVNKLTDNKKNISQVSQCKPNRIVLFDATIPHLIRPSSMYAPHYRWSINMTFRDSRNEFN